ncbi:hypothetical protein TBLA_0D04870 [Henningerozyma blattae CBS 6284]|uniref:Uncharacterized protein n=1 Tax=Henningerozyma blattae (strain ATCC 34711 / CBS 6284 / DSM 70876 / NBRC 10599 / NRRL Y-10934 / UCD 77-7) TaxID=1071380 RepID=I2H3N1_HENB6|nr:hypothetical protein TBLA_0D04870 [Tetrapisispora blattae CBS 6284]CCH60983.1 hypothetical protein TBLA_0D04870 [Tetrapisispora blattae CBS 6284]
MSVILVSAGYDHTIRFWEALTGVCSRTIQHPESQVNRLEISSDKTLLAAAANQSVRLYDLQSANPTPLACLDGHGGNVTAVAFQRERQWIATASEDGAVRVWDVRSPPTQPRIYLHGSSGSSSSTSGNSSSASSVGTGAAPVNDVAIHPNQAELVSCDRSGTLRVWDLAGGRSTHQLVPEDDIPLQSLSLSPDGSTLVAANTKGNCYVWDMPNRTDASSLKPLSVFKAHNTYITRALLSSDGKHIATCSADHTAKIWSIDNESVNLEITLDGHQRWVWDCAFSADSAYLVTASSDHYVRLWDLSTKEIVRQYGGHQKGVICVALNDI